MTTLKPYESYKSTTVPWLEALPIDWSESRLGYETWVRARLGWKGLKADEYVDSGFAFLSTPNIKRRDIDFERVNFITKERYDESPEIKLTTDDVLLAKDGSTLGTANVVRDLPVPATVNSSIAVLTPGPRCEGRYVHYLLQSELIQSAIEMLKGGMGVPHLFQDDIRRMPIPLPPREIQTRIVDYLDRETAQLDDMIAKQERLTELLAEKRQAIIAHAVTKGLDRTAPTKPSAIPWLGDIPTHWSDSRLKFVVKRIEQGVSPQADGIPASAGSWGVLKSGCVNGGVFRQSENKQLPRDFFIDPAIIVRVGDLLVSRASGSPKLVGSAARVRGLDSNLILSDKTFRFVPGPDIHVDFLEWFLNSQPYRKQVEGSISGAEGLANNISSAALKNIRLPLPPYSEQSRIARVLSRKTEALARLEGTASKTIDLLHERRAALISATVTGKVAVTV